MARRNRRVDTLVQQVVAELLDQEIGDPRLQHVTVTGARVTPDHRHATIYYTSLDPAVLAREPARTGGDRLADADEVAEALTSASPRLQGLLARRVRLRNTPVLRFEYDAVAEEARRVEELLDAVSDDLGPAATPVDEDAYRGGTEGTTRGGTEGADRGGTEGTDRGGTEGTDPDGGGGTP